MLTGGDFADLPRAVLDALPARLAAIDRTGVIVDTNAGWPRVTDDDGFADAHLTVGQNYLAWCDAANPADAFTAELAAGIRNVLAGRQPLFTLAHPGPTRCWRRLSVTPIRHAAAIAGATILHLDLPGSDSIESRPESIPAPATAAQYRLLFDRNPHPMWVYDLQTLHIVAVNDAAVSHYGYPREEFLRLTLRDLRPAEDVPRMEAAAFSAANRGRSVGRWRHLKKDGTLIDVEVSSDWLEFDGRPARLVLAHDITERVRAERELARVNRALRLLSRCNEILIRADDERTLLHDVCQIAVNLGGYRMAWVGYARTDAERSIEPVAWAGEENGYLSEIALSWSADTPAGQGPAGRSVRSGEPAICEDLSTDVIPYLEAARERGYRGAVCLPLRQGSETFGMLALYAAEIQPVGADEITLLQELANDLAFGIAHVRSDQERTRLQHAVIQIGTAISASTDAEFFRELARSVRETVGAQAALIVRLQPGPSPVGRTLAAVVGGEEVEEFEFPLAGSPCEALLTQDCHVVPRAAGARFPGAPLLARLDAEAFVGRRLVNRTGELVGLLFVLFRDPLLEPGFSEATLRIFAARAALEMERQHTETRLRDQADLLDKAQDAIVARDLDQRIIYWNKGAERLYGWSAAEALGRRADQLLHFDPGAVRLASQLVLERGEWSGELEQIDRHGRPLTVVARGTLVRDASGRPRSILFLNTDVTEKKRLEQQFLRAQRLESIGTLAGGIAHDLNNVLAPIIMAIDLLGTSVTDPAQRKLLNTISGSARRGADMVAQVLSFARGLDGRRLDLQLRHLTNELEKIMLETFPKNLRITCLAPPDLPPVTGDPTQLHQVLLNLCVNARDAMPAGGELLVEARVVNVDAAFAATQLDARPGAYVLVEVADTGTGIPAAVLDHIFDPFFTTKAVGQGTGLGLSTSLSIVKGHGGFMRVETAEGRGSRFQVYLPVSTEALRPALAPDEAPAARGQNETILVVDDEAAVREVTRDTLAHHGYRVLLAPGGAEALRLYEERRAEIDLVLTDLMMPGLDGTQTIAGLRALNPAVRIVATSGLRLPPDQTPPAPVDVPYFLPKPFTARGLLMLIQRALGD